MKGSCDPLASQASRAADGAAQEAMGGAGSACHRSKPAMRTITAGGDDNAPIAADAGCPEIDPLGLEPRAGSVPPAWIDPMLEEFAVSHLEARPLLDTYSPARVAQGTTDPPMSSPVQGTPPQTGPTVVADEAAPAADPTSTRDGRRSPDPSTPTKDAQPDTPGPSDATPTPGEAARRLARFVEEVQVKRRSPLLASPPRQKAATTRALPVRGRSRRIPSEARHSSSRGWTFAVET
jgi:hypothetical protein